MSQDKIPVSYTFKDDPSNTISCSTTGIDGSSGVRFSSIILIINSLDI
jgi:hypothetical protein